MASSRGTLLVANDAAASHIEIKNAPRRMPLWPMIPASAQAQPGTSQQA
jgi:hypothetical protein